MIMTPPTLKDLKTMIAIRFPEGNQVIYGQDFSYYRGVDPNFYWYVSRVSGGLMSLVRPGYGVAGAYGNGCLHVRIEHLIEEKTE